MQGEQHTQEQTPAPATLLFMGRIETMISQIEKSLAQNTKDHEVIMEKIDKIGDSYVKKDEFEFWRWILIVGILLSISVASIKFILS